MPIRPSDIVRARGSLWRVLAIHDGPPGCRAFRLARLPPPFPVVSRTFVEPFDRIQATRDARQPKVVSPKAATQRLVSMCASDRTWLTPTSAGECNVELLDWQLMPVVAALGGYRRRILLADGVGMGKTIQAGLLIREILNRWPEGRVLVLVPAGLRLQWRDELKAKFNLRAELVDLNWVTVRSRDAPPGINPWAEPAVVITSHDFAKQLDVLPGPELLAWNAVIVDEAHGASPGTDRAALAGAVGRRAQHLLLLTGTPHNGDDAQYKALCALAGRSNEPPPLVLTRQVDTAHARPAPSWRLLRVKPSAAERALQDVFEHYVSRLEGGANGRALTELLIHLLRKRAASSALALMRTLMRRKESLRAERPAFQAGLPWHLDGQHDDELPDAVARLPGLDSPRAESAWLGAVIEAAHRARRDDSKVTALRRLVRRVREPVLVFTEFRDTLVHLERVLRGLGPIDLLHGGMAPHERHQSVERFVSGVSRILLATDAASEGVNLHRRCRLVVMIDLPWTPTRLTQRVGRVDRFGQRRRVHAVGLTSPGSFDTLLGERLADRRTRAAAALGASAQSGDDRDQLAQSASDELRRLLRCRLLRARLDDLSRGQEARVGPQTRDDLPVIAYLRPRRASRWSGALVVVDAQLCSNEDCIDRTVVGAHVPLPVPGLRSRAAIRQFVARHVSPLQPQILRAVREHLTRRWAASTLAWHRHRSCREAPEDAARPRPPIEQLPLFGHRYQATPHSAAIDCERADEPEAEARVYERLVPSVILLREGRGHLTVPGAG